ncbi:MAG: hypothetical protein ABGY96_20940 [bacterium]|nr:hypothetical protein [Gammaproteobacteria bacterium]HIL99169.1 hypothetical protein [Pseudomonadales bacterium]
MTNDRDLENQQWLQTLFTKAQQELDGETFTMQVVQQMRIRSYRVYLGLACAVLMVATGLWILAIPLEVVQLITQLLTTSLVDLGDTWIAWLLSPINNIASLTILCVKAFRVARRKISTASVAF